MGKITVQTLRSSFKTIWYNMKYPPPHHQEKEIWLAEGRQEEGL